MSNIDENSTRCEKTSRHLQISDASPWVLRWAHLVKPNATVLDLAAGGGRHGRLFLDLGCAVTLIDKASTPLNDLVSHPQATVIKADLEDGSPWSLDGQTFDAVIVVNYLHRPLFPQLLASLNPGGVLIYETFALGNEAYCRPRNPDHLLKPNELLEQTQDRLQIIAFEQGLVTNADITGVKQRLCAINAPQGTPQPLNEK